MSKAHRTGRAIGGILSALGIGARRQGEGLGEAIKRVQGEASDEYAAALRQANERRRALDATVHSRLAEARSTGGRVNEEHERERLMAERENVLLRDDGIAVLAAALGRSEPQVLEDAKAVGRIDELTARLATGSAAADSAAVNAAAAEVTKAQVELEAAQRRLAAARGRFRGSLAAVESRTRAESELAALRASSPWPVAAPERAEPKRREPRRAERVKPEVAVEVVTA